MYNLYIINRSDGNRNQIPQGYVGAFSIEEANRIIDEFGVPLSVDLDVDFDVNQTLALLSRIKSCSRKPISYFLHKKPNSLKSLKDECEIDTFMKKWYEEYHINRKAYYL